MRRGWTHADSLKFRGIKNPALDNFSHVVATGKFDLIISCNF